MGAETGDAFQSESACKPGSVPCGGSHSSRTAIADGLKQPTRPLLGNINRGLLGLASDGACNAVNCCQPRGGLLPRLFTLAFPRYVFCGTVYPETFAVSSPFFTTDSRSAVSGLSSRSKNTRSGRPPAIVKNICPYFF